MKKLLCLALILGLRTSSLFAQNVPTSVQASASVLNSCSVAHADAALNTTVTVTLTPPSGQFVYICAWDWTATHNAGTTTAQALVKWTTTNMNSLYSQYTITATANLMVSGSYNYQTAPLRSSQAGVPVTFVSPAIGAEIMYSENVYYYFAQ